MRAVRPGARTGLYAVPDNRWRSPQVPPRDALLLLPRLPVRAQVLRNAERWSSALAAWQIEAGDARGNSGPFLVIGGVRVTAVSGADLILAAGRDRRGRLRRAGYQTQTYVAEPADAGAVILARVNGGGTCRRGSGNHERRTRILRQFVISVIRRASGRRFVTVAHRGTVIPAVVRAALGAEFGSLSVIGGGGGPRRRSAFLIGDHSGSAPHTVIKVGPSGSEMRGVREQEVLRGLQAAGLGQNVPRPLGRGNEGPLYWSAESAKAGKPLSDVLVGARRWHQIAGTLEQLVAWFTCLGISTRIRDNTDTVSRLPLRGEFEALSTLRRSVLGVPRIVVHGDVGSGFNVLIDGDSFAIIDWETSLDAELPLTDLLPLLCNALAALHGHSTDAAAAYILSLCAGHEAHSEWLLASVRSYCRDVGVPLSACGALAALTWGYQASMRLVHDEQLIQAGEIMASWDSPADRIARGWMEHADLGLEWRALTSGGGQ